MKPPAVQLDVPGVRIRGVQGRHLGAQCGGRGHGLERRAGRLQHLHPQPHRGFHRTGLGVEHDCPAVPPTQRIGHVVLDVDAKRGDHVFRLGTGALAQRPHRAGLGDGLEIDRGAATEHAVKRLLQSRLAVRTVCGPALGNPCGHPLGGGSLDIPGDVRERGALRIDAVGGRATGQDLAVSGANGTAGVGRLGVCAQVLTRRQAGEHQLRRPQHPEPGGRCHQPQVKRLAHVPKHAGVGDHGDCRYPGHHAGGADRIDAFERSHVGGLPVGLLECSQRNRTARARRDQLVHGGVVTGAPGGDKSPRGIGRMRAFLG